MPQGRSQSSNQPPPFSGFQNLLAPWEDCRGSLIEDTSHCQLLTVSSSGMDRFLLRHARRRLLVGPMLALAFLEMLQQGPSSSSRSYYYCRAENLSTGQDVDSYVEQEIARSDVTIFAKTYCPYCKHARHLIQDVHDQVGGFTFHVVDLDLLPEDDGPIIQMELLTKSHQRTVPNVFVKGQHIGGDSDLTHLHETGQLTKLLLQEL